MLEKIDKIQTLLNVPNVDADPKTAIANMKILNLLVDLRAEAKQLILSGVSCSAFKDDILKKTETMIWFARENYNKDYYEGVLNAMRNLQVNIKKLYKKHYH